MKNVLKMAPVAGLAGGLLQLGMVTSWAGTAEWQTLFVDPLIVLESCTNYSPATRSCGEGSEQAYRTIAGAAAATRPGTIVSIRAGIYREPINPPISGTSEQPIVFRAREGEAVALTDYGPTYWLDPAIRLFGVSNIVIEGITVTNVQGWLRADGASWNSIRRCRFLYAHGSGSRNGLKFVGSDHNQILDNFLDDGWINLSLIDSDHNLVQGNVFQRGRFALWNIRCGNFNVVRSNVFNNELQQIGQITDCAGWPSSTPRKSNATAHNLVEDNVFELTPRGSTERASAGLQCSGQQTIVRRNRFYRTGGPALELTFHPWIEVGTNIFGEDARFVVGSRIYNNVFYQTRFAGAGFPPAETGLFADHIFKNNVLAEGVFENTDSFSAYTNLVGKPVQVFTERLDGFVFEQNSILGEAPGQAYVIAHAGQPSSGETLAWWERTYPHLFTNNVELPAQFVNADTFDFHLTPSSPLIDRGTFLTRTISDGTGLILAVEDVTCFYDGFGIAGALGDEIQIENQTGTARILQINYDDNTLALDRPLSWTAGQGVSLRYLGPAPDIGAFEFVPAGPRLRIEHDIDLVVVSWPEDCRACALESATSLGALDWQPETTARLKENMWTLTRPMERGVRYFRLVHTPPPTP